MKDRARVCLGAFAGAFGVRGEAKVKTFTLSEIGVADYGPVESENGERRFTLTFIRVLKPGLAIVSAPEIKSREDAAALAGIRLYVAREALPDLGEGDEFYIEDLVGLSALDETGAKLGVVIAVHNFGAGDLLEIRLADIAATRMVAFSTRDVPTVDIARGFVVLAQNARESLFDTPVPESEA